MALGRASSSTPHCQPLTVNPSLSTPHCQPLTVNPSLLTPHCQPLTVNPSLSTPHRQPLCRVSSASIHVFAHRMLISHKYKLSFRLVPKAGGSSIVEAARSVLPGILLLNYWVDVGSKGLPKCHPSVMPEREKEQLYPSVADQRYLVVGNMRDPVDRFISAYNYFARRTGHDPNSTTDFVDVLRKGFECAHYAWGVKEWGYKGFMHFLPATGFFLLPNLLYAPDNDTLPYIDKLFRLEELDELLPYLELVKKGSVSATGPGKAPAVDKLVLAKKPLAVKNARPHDGSSEMFKKLLSDKQDIMRLHCRSFIQDYICFDYPLPEECADMVPW
eukprot:jgi/Mesvir1/26176/Mv06873-RA.1